ncbi:MULTISPECIES: hypothetical protein [Paenibacillus]|uniref:hypothetical protein n=1 Tax=Paenibacillus TaxID=44249 RepID=UPI001B29F015|nr:hypothetical protein [Paenibacillus lactis]GIO89575.1 hypothetical protein J31TS3_08020 [Paenibacillus lactis]
MSLLNTSNPDALYDSLAEIFSAPRHLIEYAVIRNTFAFQRLSSAEEVDLNEIKKIIDDKTGTETHIGDFDYVTIAHLTTRSDSSIENSEPLYNLHDLLLRDTEFSMKLRESGITFSKSKNGIDTYLDGKLVDWESMIPRSNEEPCIRMIMRRLQLNPFFPVPDKCINGYLFGGDIWENSDVRHIVVMPEFAENILRALGKRKAIDEWRVNVKPYVITFQAPISGIIFDGSNKLNRRQTQFCLLRHAFYYLNKVRQDEWDQWHNPIIRLGDDISIDANQILSLTKVII